MSANELKKYVLVFWRTRRPLERAAAIAFGVILAVGAFFWLWPESIDSDAVFYFQTKGVHPGEKYFLRAESSGSDALLYMYERSEGPDHPWHGSTTTPRVPVDRTFVYRLDPLEKSLDEIRSNAWDEAGTDVCEYPRCGELVDGLSVDRKARRLIHNNARVATKGRNAIRYLLSPDRKLVAVLSAAGWRTLSIFPFLGGGGFTGKHYHQFFTWPEMKPLGTAVLLPVRTSKITIDLAWSPDSQYVIYNNPNSYTYLCVIPVHRGKKEGVDWK